MNLEAAYAAGRLDPALALILETRAALLGDERLAQAETAAALLFEREDEGAMSPGALAAALARLPVQDAAPAVAEEELALPAPLRAAMAGAAARWRFKAPGMKVLALNTGGAAKAELLRIEPGFGAPMHTHRGAEITLVLQGAYQDGHRRYARGDLSIAGPELRHRPVAEQGEICYALVATEAGLEFEGALGALQKVFGR